MTSHAHETASSDVLNPSLELISTRFESAVSGGQRQTLASHVSPRERSPTTQLPHRADQYPFWGLTAKVTRSSAKARATETRSSLSARLRPSSPLRRCMRSASQTTDSSGLARDGARHQPS